MIAISNWYKIYLLIFLNTNTFFNEIFNNFQIRFRNLRHPEFVHFDPKQILLNPNARKFRKNSYGLKKTKIEFWLFIGFKEKKKFTAFWIYYYAKSMFFKHLRMSGTYIPNKKFYLTGISVLCDITKIWK